MIVIVDSLHPDFYATFFTNSPVTGNWEDYFIQDVISYVDEQYPTIKTSEGRGILGFSMGGMNGLNIGLKYSNMFKAVFGLSPAVFGEDKNIFTFLEYYQTSDEIFSKVFDFQEELVGTVENSSDDTDYFTNILEILGAPADLTDSFRYYVVTYGLAFVSNTSKKGIYYDFLYERNISGDGCVLNSEHLPRWNSGGGNFTAKISSGFEQNPELQIGLYYGLQEPAIMEGATHISNLLTNQGFSHQINVTDHGHNEEMLMKLTLFIAPFFQQYLKDAIIKSTIFAYPSGLLLISSLFVIANIIKKLSRIKNSEIGIDFLKNK